MVLLSIILIKIFINYFCCFLNDIVNTILDMIYIINIYYQCTCTRPTPNLGLGFWGSLFKVGIRWGAWSCQSKSLDLFWHLNWGSFGTCIRALLALASGLFWHLYQGSFGTCIRALLALASGLFWHLYQGSFGTCIRALLALVYKVTV